LDQLEILANRMGDTAKYIADHEHELKSMLNDQDWLHIYSKLISDCNIDMDHFIRRA
jgi:hypothetical protein